MKVDVLKHRDVLVQNLSEISGMEPEIVGQLFDAMEKLFKKKLPCTKCNRWLPHEAFHAQTTAFNRYGRVGQCKICHGAYDPRRMGKGEVGEDGKLVVAKRGRPKGWKAGGGKKALPEGKWEGEGGYRVPLADLVTDEDIAELDAPVDEDDDADDGRDPASYDAGDDE